MVLHEIHTLDTHTSHKLCVLINQVPNVNSEERKAAVLINEAPNVNSEDTKAAVLFNEAPNVNSEDTKAQPHAEF